MQSPVPRSTHANSKSVVVKFLDVFISEIKGRPILWDNKLKQDNYGIRRKMNEEWESVAEKFDKPIDEVKSKWRNLRDTFYREEKKLKLPLVDEGKPLIHYYTGHWSRFEQLIFLHNTRSYTRNVEYIEVNESELCTSNTKEKLEASEQSYARDPVLQEKQQHVTLALNKDARCSEIDTNTHTESNGRSKEEHIIEMNESELCTGNIKEELDSSEHSNDSDPILEGKEQTLTLKLNKDARCSKIKIASNSGYYQNISGIRGTGITKTLDDFSNVIIKEELDASEHSHNSDAFLEKEGHTITLPLNKDARCSETNIDRYNTSTTNALEIASNSGYGENICESRKTGIKRTLDDSNNVISSKKQATEPLPVDIDMDEDMLVNTLEPFLRKLNPVRKLIVRNELQTLLLRELLCDHCRVNGLQPNCRCNYS